MSVFCRPQKGFEADMATSEVQTVNSTADKARVAAAVAVLIAGLVACYRGLTITGGGAKAVGNAVNETVVYAFMALFVVNVVVTAIGIRMTVK